MFPAGVSAGSSDNPGHSSTHLILWRRFTRVQDEGHRPDAAGGPTGGRVRCHCSLPAVVVPEEGLKFIRCDRHLSKPQCRSFFLSVGCS